MSAIVFELDTVDLVVGFTARDTEIQTGLGGASGMMLVLQVVPGERFDAFMAAGQPGGWAQDRNLLFPPEAIPHLIEVLHTAHLQALADSAPDGAS